MATEGKRLLDFMIGIHDRRVTGRTDHDLVDISVRIIELLRKLVRDYAILLVEHDMDAVFAVANVLTVMVNGNVLESGPPEQIRASGAVQEAYLGAEEVPE